MSFINYSDLFKTCILEGRFVKVQVLSDLFTLIIEVSAIRKTSPIVVSQSTTYLWDISITLKGLPVTVKLQVNSFDLQQNDGTCPFDVGREAFKSKHVTLRKQYYFCPFSFLLSFFLNVGLCPSSNLFFSSPFEFLQDTQA